jgi:hypothetical protein
MYYFPALQHLFMVTHLVAVHTALHEKMTVGPSHIIF